MYINRIQFLREILVADGKGNKTSTMEFSYDSGDERAPHFFEVPDEDVSQTRELYMAWGGSRPEGFQVGTTVRAPWIPPVLSKSIWN